MGMGHIQRWAVGLAAVAALGAASSAFAATAAGGRAYGVGVSANVPLGGITTGVPVADTGAQSVPPGLSFSQSASLASLAVIAGSPLTLGLNTGVINAETEGALNLNNVTSEASVANLGLGLSVTLPVVGSTALTNLTADAITATATATCVGGAPQFTAQTQIANLVGSVFGNPAVNINTTLSTQQDLVNVSVPDPIPPIASPMIVARLSLNDQSVTGNRITVNALRFVLIARNPINNAILVNLDIAIGHAEAELADCDPVVTVDVQPQPILLADQNAVQVSGICTPDAGAVAITVADAVNVPSTTDVTASATCQPDGTYSTTVDVSSQNDGNLTFTAEQGSASDDETVLKNVALAVVTVDSAPPITASNDDAYPVAGTCTYDSANPAYNTVSVTIGSASTTTQCQPGGTWSATLDVTAVPDGSPITVTAEQSNVNGTETGTRDTSKNTAVAPPAVTAVPVGGAWAGLLLLATGMGVLRRRAKAGRA